MKTLYVLLILFSSFSVFGEGPTPVQETFRTYRHAFAKASPISLTSAAVLRFGSTWNCQASILTDPNVNSVNIHFQNQGNQGIQELVDDQNIKPIIYNFVSDHLLRVEPDCIENKFCFSEIRVTSSGQLVTERSIPKDLTGHPEFHGTSPMTQSYFVSMYAMCSLVGN